ncbi:RAxF-45 family protein [Psychrobacillus sp. NPDC058041]
MKNTVNAHGFILEFLSTSCAITHEIEPNGTSLFFFRQFNVIHS